MIRRLRNSISVFLLLSLLFHAGLVTTAYLKKARPVNVRPAPVEVQFVTPQELQKAKPKPPVVIPAPAVKVTDQVVEQKDKINDEIDKNTRFLSAHNQKVIQQTRAENDGKFKNTAAGGKPDQGQKDGDKNQKSLAQAKAAAKAKHQSKAPREKGDLPALADLSPKFSMNPGQKAPESDKTGDPSQSDDYLKDVNKGMQTLLSTREFVYYSYYARIKEAIRQHWEPTVREKVKIIYRQGRSIASAHDRVTQVLVTLNSKGELVNVEVLTQSGVEALDSAAVEAFRAASPFPNPPKGMVEADGFIKIRWDFVLEA